MGKKCYQWIPLWLNFALAYMLDEILKEIRPMNLFNLKKNDSEMNEYAFWFNIQRIKWTFQFLSRYRKFIFLIFMLKGKEN